MPEEGKGGSLALPRRRKWKDGLYAPQWEETYGRRRGQPQFNMARRRINEMEMLIRHRHGVIPPTDDADMYLFPVAQHLREIVPDSLTAHLSGWCARWAPEVPKAQIEEIARRAAAKGYRFKADTLAHMLRVKDVERKELGITTIGAIDRPKKERIDGRLKAKRKRDRERAMRNRRRRGARPRSEYLANCLSQKQPWIAEGISRRTWERRRGETTPPGDASPSQ
jgi:hypothetical protein